MPKRFTYISATLQTHAFYRYFARNHSTLPRSSGGCRYLISVGSALAAKTIRNAGQLSRWLLIAVRELTWTLYLPGRLFYLPKADRIKSFRHVGPHFLLRVYGLILAAA